MAFHKLLYNPIRPSAQAMVRYVVTRLQCTKCCTRVINELSDANRERLLAESRVYWDAPL